MKAYKAILYDLDGTLVNTMDMNLYPLMRILEEELGQKWAFADLIPYFTKPGPKVLEELGIRDIETVYARWVRYVNEYVPGAVPYEGVPEVLAAFQKAGIRQAAVSAKLRPQYEIDVVGNGLDVYLETAVLAEDTPHHKPHPEPILTALKRLGLEPGEALYVGDARSDLEAARNAGVDFGFAAWGAAVKLGREEAGHWLDRPEELLQLVCGL